METEVKRQACPICGAQVSWSERYPAYLCENCYSRAASEDGRPLVFGNLSINGGFVAFYADSMERYPAYICFVDGVECYADEARFGGIVIQPVKEDQSTTPSQSLPSTLV